MLTWSIEKKVLVEKRRLKGKMQFRLSTGGQEGRREAEKACTGQKCIYKFSDLLTVRKGSTRFRDSFVLGLRTAGCAFHHNVALYPSFLIRVHHPRGVLFSFASLLYLSLFLLSLLVSSSLYKSKDEPRCYVYLSPSTSSLLSSSVSRSPSRSLPLPLVRNVVPPAPCTASDDALYAAPVILLASILFASAFSVVQGLPKRASRLLRRGRERKRRSVRRRKRALTHGRRDAKSQSATRFYTAGYPRLLSYTGCPKHVERSFTFSKYI